MTKRRSKNQTPFDWRAILTDPRFRQIAQQILALCVFAVGIVTLLALLGVTKGFLVDPWVNLLRYLFGWGIIPIAVAILAAGLLWLAHQLDRPITWRWRPFVGAELAFFSLLGLTHAVASRGDLWGLVEAARVGSLGSGGLIGWAISATLLEYAGSVPTVLLLLALLSLGLGLAFDVTLDDVKQVVAVMRGRFAERAERRQAGPKSAVQRERPRPLEPERLARPAPPPVTPRREPTPQKAAPPPPLASVPPTSFWRSLRGR
jgi:hypothetical protein